MAELARALGHEVNNTLGAMTLQIELLAQDTPATGFARASVGILEAAAQQGITLVRRVRDLARLSRPLAPRPVDLRAAVDGALQAVQPRLAGLPGVKLTTAHAETPPVLGDPDEIGLAVRELVTNALDAVGDAGRVHVVTAVDGAFVACRVVDDGDGMTPETRAQAFEPFVSVHPERGRGLGLTIALAVAVRHDGEVTLAAAPRRGSVATLRVPRAR
jgi:signal transduction histidine kinase